MYYKKATIKRNMLFESNLIEEQSCLWQNAEFYIDPHQKIFCAKIMLQSLIPVDLRAVREERDRKKRECIGQIYIVGSECETYPYKIGFSKSGVKRRVSSMQTAHFVDLKIFLESPAIPQVESVEKILHKKYAKKQQRGEWFNLTKRDINIIQKELIKYSLNPSLSDLYYNRYRHHSEYD